MSTAAKRATVFAPKEEITYAARSVVSQQIIKSKAGNITLFAFSEGEGLSEHTAPFDAALHVLDGTAEIRLAGESHDMQAGQMIILPANVAHAVHATTDFKMLLTMIRG